MKIHILGTGGADGIPALFGKSRVDQYARCHGKKDVRSRSAALIDDTHKIDLGPDTLSQVQRLGLDPTLWENLWITHSDDDHLTVSEIQYGLFPFVENDHLAFTIFGSPTTLGLIHERYPNWPIDFVELKPFFPVVSGSYEVTPIRAHHNPNEECFNFIFRKGDKQFLYGTDTGVYSEETFEFLENRKIDCLVIECSDGHHKTSYVGHMDFAQCVEVVDRLRKSNALADEALVFTTHHTGRGDATHAEITTTLAPYRIAPAFDGQIINL